MKKKPESMYASIDKPVMLHDELSQKLHAHPGVGYVVILVEGLRQARAIADKLEAEQPTTRSTEFAKRLRWQADDIERRLRALNEDGGDVNHACGIAVGALALGGDMEAALADARWTKAVREKLRRNYAGRPLHTDEEIAAALSKYKTKKEAAVALGISPKQLRRREKKRTS